MKAFLAAAGALAIAFAATAAAQAAALQVSVRVLSGVSIETSQTATLDDVSAVNFGAGLRSLPPVLVRMSLKTGSTGTMSLGVLSGAPAATMVAQCDAASVSNCVAWGPHTSASVQVRLTVSYPDDGIIPIDFGASADAFNVIVSQT